MFTKVDEAEDRSNKKKMSSDVKNLDVKPTSSIRHKASLAEETQEELTERILKELEEQNRIFEREAATQMCTRCNRNLVSPEFWVDKHLGFCEECAAILKLGQSKEARKVEYQLGAMDGDSLDEEDEDFIGPDADDLKEAEEDLAEMGE
jgi:methionyl-tRNA synthetase